MKIRYRLLLTCAFTMLSIISFAQLKILSSGDYLVYDSSQLYPETDYGISLGASNRFSSIGAGTGDFYSVNSTEVWFYNLYDMSDKRLKSNIGDLSKSAGEKLFNLRPVRYNLTLERRTFKDSLKTVETKMETSEHIGFIAQEVKEVFPELVGENKDGMLGIRYIELIPVLVQALKEQKEKIKNLEERIGKLENAGK